MRAARADRAHTLTLTRTLPGTLTLALSFHRHRSPLTAHHSPFTLTRCERVGERILGADACFWTSRMLGVRPSDSISLRKFWDWRFRFYWAKKHYVAQLLRLGFSVLQARDTLIILALTLHTRTRTHTNARADTGKDTHADTDRGHPPRRPAGGHRHGLGARPLPGAARHLPQHQRLAGRAAGQPARHPNPNPNLNPSPNPNPNPSPKPSPNPSPNPNPNPDPNPDPNPNPNPNLALALTLTLTLALILAPTLNPTRTTRSSTPVSSTRGRAVRRS